MCSDASYLFAFPACVADLRRPDFKVLVAKVPISSNESLFKIDIVRQSNQLLTEQT